MHIVNGILFVIVVVLGVCFIQPQQSNTISSPALLPSDTLIYLEQNNGASALANFKKSRLGKSLASIDLPGVLQKTGVHPSYIALVNKVLITINQVQQDALVRTVLGKKLGIALFAPREWMQKSSSIKEYVESHSLLISMPSINEVKLETLVSTYIKDITVSTVPYGHYSIRRYILNNSRLSVAFCEGLLLASFEERVIREALDIYDQKSDSLMNYTYFNEFNNELKNAERSLYLEIEGLQGVVESWAKNAPTLWSKELISEFSTLKGVVSISHGTWRDEAELHNKIFIHLNKARMGNQIRELAATQPSMNLSLPFISQDALFYYWSNTLNSRLLWDMYVAESGDDTFEIDYFQKRVEDVTGYSLYEIIQMVSNNVGILVNKNERDRFVPIPDLALIVRLTHPQNIQDVISKTLKNLDIKAQGRTYKGVRYYYWGIYPQESLQPVYSIHRDYLIIANTRDILQEIIDTPITPRRLVESSAFQELDPGFQTRNNSVCYVDHEKLLVHLKELLNWMGTFIAIQDRKASEKTKIIIENMLNPLIDGMGMYKKSATRTYIQGDLVIVESQTQMSQ